MTLLISGLLLWYLSHLLKRLAPGARAAMGENPGKMLVSLMSFASIILMVMGFRRAEFVPLYTPLAGMGHLNNLLMLIALFLFSLVHSKGRLKARLRHPMLMGTILWAVAHLLVNGDLASVLLFGGIGLWAVLSILLINAQSDWARPAPGPIRSDIIAGVVALVLYAAITGFHIWMGHNPFLGTYG